LQKVMLLIKDRCTLLPDFYTQGKFFFESPASYDEASVKPKWDVAKKDFFETSIKQFQGLIAWDAATLEDKFKQLAAEKNIKIGELQMIFRIMLVGSKTGPAVFVIAETIGKAATIQRINNALEKFNVNL